MPHVTLLHRLLTTTQNVLYPMVYYNVSSYYGGRSNVSMAGASVFIEIFRRDLKHFGAGAMFDSPCTLS